MAVLVIQDFEARRDEYDQVSAKLGDEIPKGGIVHTACDLGGGKMRAVDVWGSAEDYQSFVQDKLIPAIAEVNPDAPQAGEPEVLEVYHLQTA
jgi:hypothetical protein